MIRYLPDLPGSGRVGARKFVGVGGDIIGASNLVKALTANRAQRKSRPSESQRKKFSNRTGIRTSEKKPDGALTLSLPFALLPLLHARGRTEGKNLIIPALLVLLFLEDARLA